MEHKKLYSGIATVLGLGYFPFAPGTAGSLGGLLLCLILHGHVIIYTLIFLALFTAGVIVSDKIAEETGLKDPSIIVIDEFTCIFPVFFLVPVTPLIVIIGFTLYRLMDIIKPPPIKLLERLRGGWGIMLDDLVAAIYTNIALQILVYVFRLRV